MNIKQYWKHLWTWIIFFPLPREKEHAYMSAFGDKTEECMICGKIVEKSQKDIDVENKRLKKEFLDPNNLWEKKILENIDAFKEMSTSVRKNIILQAFGEERGRSLLETYFGDNKKKEI